MLLVEQPHDEPADREQEHERLLAVHEDPAEVLVTRRRQPPQPRRVLVERVERAAGEDVREAEEGRADERDREVAEPCRRREATAHDRPPEEKARGHEDPVLEVQSPAGAERPVVERGEMRQVPRAEPERKDPARPEPSEAVASELFPHLWRQAEHDEKRRHVRDQRVLEQVHEQQVLRRDRLQR